VPDWTDELDPEERDAWEEFVEHFRRGALEAMDESAFVTSLVPREHDVDVKFAVELGAAIMLNKPILAVVAPGAEVPDKLRLVVDDLIRADVDTEEGRQEIGRAILKFKERLDA
jgi:nucleoside 2-deoxyribosyltransferase